MKYLTAFFLMIFVIGMFILYYAPIIITTVIIGLVIYYIYKRCTKKEMKEDVVE